MNTYVQRASDPNRLADCDPESSKHALPEGFHFLVAGDGQVVEPVLSYLRSSYLSRTTRKLVGYSQLTVASTAYELADFWRFLALIGKPWNEVGIEELERYRDSMDRVVSPTTQREYSPSTLAHRISTVIGLYRWAATADLLRSGTDLAEQLTRRGTGAATGHKYRQGRSAHVIALPRPKDVSDEVKVLRIDEYRRIAQELGPLPAVHGIKRTDHRPIRDRLMAELAIQVGLRRIEVIGLKVPQILAHPVNPEHPYRVMPLKLIKTKGGRSRTVLVPNWLVGCLVWYIDNDREEAAKSAKRLDPKSRDDLSLFLSHPWARQHRGKPLGAGSVDKIYKKAVVRAGLTTEHFKREPVTRTSYLATEASHVFHGLRHTFAVWTYYARRQQGDAEPWKYIQAQLGHRSLQTTLDIYLRAASDFEAVVSDAMLKQMQTMRAWGGKA